MIQYSLYLDAVSGCAILPHGETESERLETARVIVGHKRVSHILTFLDGTSREVALNTARLYARAGRVAHIYSAGSGLPAQAPEYVGQGA